MILPIDSNGFCVEIEILPDGSWRCLKIYEADEHFGCRELAPYEWDLVLDRDKLREIDYEVGKVTG